MVTDKLEVSNLVYSYVDDADEVWVGWPNLKVLFNRDYSEWNLTLEVELKYFDEIFSRELNRW